MASPGPPRQPSLALALLAAAVLLPGALPAHAPLPRQRINQRAPNQHDDIDPASLPAHDSHQGLLVAVRADTTAEASKAKFGEHNPFGAGIVGLDVYFRNDTDRPIRVTSGTVQLFIGAPGEKPQQLDQLSHEEVTDLILSKPKDPTATHRSPIPVPPHVVPAHNKNWQKLDDLLRNATLPTATLQPHSTTHGYFYFDINHKFEWLSNAHLDVPDLVFPDTNQGLLFFEIDLTPSASPVP